MDSLKNIPALISKWLSTCASMVVSLLLLFFPGFLKRWLSDPMTLQIDEYHGISSRNQLFGALELYLQNKISPSTRLLKIAQTRKDSIFSTHFSDNQEFEDVYEDIQLKWKFNIISKESNHHPSLASKRKQYFQLIFDLEQKEKVMNSYLPYVLETFKAMKEERKLIKLHTLVRVDPYKIRWDAINLEHPATFETLAMDLELKTSVLEDLEKFVKRKEFYQRVGRAWKRGYLLYGPPGTGKSSLVAAMANYLKFDIYDLQLTHLKSDMELRKALIATTNKSILVIEDIDCSQAELQDRNSGKGSRKNESEGQQITLSGLLNFTDGLWSSCGEERIFIFTTNHKSKLDPALLRSGRMDMHIHMSYCSYEGFKTLASNYLGVCDHPLFENIESLLKNTKITPAQIAEALMKSEDAEVALQGLITVLKEKRYKGDEYLDEGEGEHLTYFI
ncbi:PREDICTED: mitochondrial chaperone BCS1-like [Fragaria vesca subsp. vesca]|uniref:mitochondrial chaperone BCS1-like n=1 Tax=Fragaria vesca subsp. vesca TaxID=101020 RepID=UPI0002C2E70A|nr:PREDICTED: mitochondrial chaperone BCS1-like [Fragaria vesca subsp. vesca]XP_011460485.1 PREDICTED: mitochondrial chaperone BCS1-like [Fragaria vesca subsp. vesca]